MFAQEVNHLEYFPEFEIDLEVPVENASQVATGGRHSCARLDDGSIECWGSNSAGQLGADRQEVTVSLIATKVQGLEAATMVATGDSHSCALVAGDVYCWGANSRSQLGRAADEEQQVPKRVEGLSDVTSIALGPDFSCALNDSGEVLCWGANSRGTLGVDPGQTLTSQVPVRLPFTDVVEIAAGGTHLCAQTRDAQVHCLGDNVHGQLGDGHTSPDPGVTPVQAEPLRGSKP
jgi:alpha-tubulin suppressor-like RCC1 family protein